MKELFFFAQDCSNSIANALELLRSWYNLSENYIIIICDNNLLTVLWQKII